MTQQQRPVALVLAAPSGAGKTSLARAIVERRPDVVFSLSATTRPPRPGERHDEDYHFVDDAGFDALEHAGRLLEWAHVHGRRYGTLRPGVEAALERGQTVLLDIDVQGARRVRQALPDAMLVFVLPPSLDEMLRRLQARGSESADELATRLRTAHEELGAVSEFDHVIINDDFEGAIRGIEAILDHRRGDTPADPRITVLTTRLRTDIDAIIQRSN